MVLGRNDKRKRKEGDLVDLMDPLSESPKRTKVHAQRKFAQGAATVFSPAPPLVKEKEKSKPAVITELITHKRPNTKDFLTFLCFRGTSILPPSLNFFNVGAKKEKTEGKGGASRGSGKNSSSSTPSASSASATKAETSCGASGKSTQKSTTTTREKIVESETQKTMSKYKNATSTIQALKKKYQEQRLAKQRIRNKFKPSCVMRTRSSTDRAVHKSLTKIPSRKYIPRVDGARRHGLRSGRFAEKTKKPNVTSAKLTKVTTTRARKKCAKEETSESEETEIGTSDEEDGEGEEDEEDDEEEPEEEEEEEEEREEERTKKNTGQIRKASCVKTLRKKICTRSKSEMRRITRSQIDNSATKQSSPSRRPSRKTKEAATVYMEILGRKLVSPDLDNEDDVSVDSFPELPNARRTAQAENEMRAKSKAAKSKEATREKASKPENATTTSLRTRGKIEKPNVKSKRTLRVRRYCELDSEDESETSMEPEKPRQPTRRASSSTKIEKPSPRSLRSSSRNQAAKIDKTTKSPKEKTARKKATRKKRESDESEDEEEGQEEAEEQEEEEETLGNLLSKMTKRKVEKIDKMEKTTIPRAVSSSVTEAKLDDSSLVATKSETRIDQVSDDEESFRGFTKKAISKVLNNCNNHQSANLLDETSGDIDARKRDVTTKPEASENEKIDDKSRTEDARIVPTIKAFDNGTKILSSMSEMEKATFRAPLKIETKCTNHASTTTANDESSLNLIDISLGENNHGRKARVNMSTEEIEKWLNDSSMAREKSRNPSELENASNYHFEINTDKIKCETNHLSIPSRIQHLVRPVNVTIPKLMEKLSRERMANQNKMIGMPLGRFPPGKTLNVPTPNRNKINADIKEIIKGRSVKNATREASTCDEEMSDGVSKSDQNSIDGTPEKKTTPDKKAIFHQRKTFLPRVKERKTAIPSANAFSPENESSVYAFESDTEIPINTPFRRRFKERSTSKTKITETTNVKPGMEDSTMKHQDGKKLSSVSEAEKFLMPKSFGDLTKVQLLTMGKMSNEWTGVNCGTSIAVQVNFDEQTRDERASGSKEISLDGKTSEDDGDARKGDGDEQYGQSKSTEISTQTENTNDNENDNDGHVFYIPLQTVGRNCPNLGQGQQLIQGVAVKLGTEGPNGPNQRVLLRAQLVTKPPMTVARCPPVGTVQPTTRNPPNSSTSTTSVLDHPYAVSDTTVASTSAGTSTNPTSQISTDSPRSQAQLSRNSTPLNSATMKQHVGGAAIEKPTKSPKASRERKASVDSTKVGKRATAKSRQKTSEIIPPSNSTIFPCSTATNAEARLVEAPTFHPTEKDFQDPLEYIDKIRSIAEKFGICRVVPPANFKPECKVSDDMRFTAYNQYVHRMLHRWGPNVKEMMAIKKYLATQSITLTHPPWIGGMEVDLPHLYQTVQSLGGLKEVIEKKKWQKVADGMKIPKSAQDRVTKLDDIYCKYLLPYDTLSPEERGKLFDDVEEDWKKRETRTLQRLDAQSNDNDEDEDDDSSDEIEECIIKGRNMPLNAFYRIARNTQRMWFGENQRTGNEAEGASAIEVEAAFWKHVAERKRHVCVHAASIDSSGRGFGFSVAKNSPFARHPWNLKVLTNNAGSVLRALGPLMGVTVPTLHVGMLFSACCWYRDPHGLPWIEYLHTGAKKIWYGIPDEHNNNFREALSKMVPRYCKKKTIWLPSDTAMVPPELLVNNGVPLCRTVQEPGQFIVVFPKAFTSSICTGYVVSESVYFAQPAWLENAEQVFKDLQDSCEPSIFSFERLLFSIINDSRSQYDVLKQIMPVVLKIRERELDYRKQLEYIGLKDKEKLPLPGTSKGKKSKRIKEEDGDFECETCRANLFVSLVNNSHDDSVYCLPHALQLLVRKKQVLKDCTLMYTYTEDELDDLIHKLEDRIEAKSKKNNQIRQSKQ